MDPRDQQAELSAEGQALSEETKADRFMRSRLPAYSVNCLLVAGFDTLDVLAKMDVGQEPCNSIELVEDFVTANFSALVMQNIGILR